MLKLNEDTEEFNQIKQEWKEVAKDTTLATLPDFVRHLTEDYEHDYGTICHAIAVAANAAAIAMNKSPTGGITGFQADAVMCEFIREWNFQDNKTGLQLVDFDDFLYPQLGYRYNTLSADVWNNLQKEAAQLIAKAKEDQANYEKDKALYDKEIAAFVLKYPDYYDREKHYLPLGLGTADEWAAEQAKRDSGFVFAPLKPYSTAPSDRVHMHWESIVNGIVPFGYEVEEC